MLTVSMAAALTFGCGSKASDGGETTAAAAESSQETSVQSSQETYDEAAPEAASDAAEQAANADGAGEETPDYTTGKPWLDSNIEGNVTADIEVSLKDDFYLAVDKDIVTSNYSAARTA